MTEDIFNLIEQKLGEIDFNAFKAIRVQDPGAIYYLLKKSNCLIQLKLDNGNHNYSGILKWKEIIGDRLDRIILSSELPINIIKEYRQKLNNSLEILGFGKLLLFYTPRSLLTPYVEGNCSLKASSEESPHRGFSVIQNHHGTFMFHPKELFLLDEVEKILEAGVDYIRIDHRFIEHKINFNALRTIVEKGSNQKGKEFKENYPEETFKGFFKTNKTDILFKKLKNKHLVMTNDQSFLGTVLESMKMKHLCLDLRMSHHILKPGDKLRFITTEGTEKSYQLSWVKSSSLEELVDSSNHSIVFIPYLKAVGIRSLVFLDNAQ